MLNPMREPWVALNGLRPVIWAPMKGVLRPVKPRVKRLIPKYVNRYETRTPEKVEKIIYHMLIVSVVIALIIAVVGLTMLYASPEAWKEAKYEGASPATIAKLIAGRDPRGILGLTAPTLIAGVLASIIAVIVHSAKNRDKALLAISIILLILLVTSTIVGLAVKSLSK